MWTSLLCVWALLWAAMAVADARRGEWGLGVAEMFVAGFAVNAVGAVW